MIVAIIPPDDVIEHIAGEHPVRPGTGHHYRTINECVCGPTIMRDGDRIMVVHHMLADRWP